MFPIFFGYLEYSTLISIYFKLDIIKQISFRLYKEKICMRNNDYDDIKEI